MSELLPDPATPVTRVRTAVGISTSTPLRLFSRASRIGSQPVGVRTSLLDRKRAVEIAASQGVGVAEVGERALEHDLAAGVAGARPHVDEVVGDTHDVRVVLDDDDGVALVAQLLEQLGQPMHVARMEADARLVEDVHRVDQAAAEVLDHLDALRLAARQRVGLAVEAEVVEPDVDHRLEALDEAGDDRLRDRVSEQPQERDQVADLHRGELGDVVAVDLGPECSLAEASAVAQRARPEAEVRLDGLLGPLGPGLDVAPDVGTLELLEDAEVRGVHRLVADPQLVLAILPPQQEVHLLRSEVGQLLVVVEEAGPRVLPDLPVAPHRHLDGALVERLRHVEEVVRHDAHLLAKPVAFGAHALRIVEGERVRIADGRLADA